MHARAHTPTAAATTIAASPTAPRLTPSGRVPGFLRVRNVLDEDTVAAALDASLTGIEQGAFGELLGGAAPGEHVGGDFYPNAFVHNKIIERVATTPRLLDYVCHVLNDQPRLSEQILMTQNHTHPMCAPPPPPPLPTV